MCENFSVLFVWPEVVFVSWWNCCRILKTRRVCITIWVSIFLENSGVKWQELLPKKRPSSSLWRPIPLRHLAPWPLAYLPNGARGTVKGPSRSISFSASGLRAQPTLRMSRSGYVTPWVSVSTSVKWGYYLPWRLSCFLLFFFFIVLIPFWGNTDLRILTPA